MSSWQNKFYKFIFRVMFRLQRNPNIEKQRKMLDRTAKFFKPPANTKVESFMIDHLPAEWVSVGKVNSKKIILYFHGGYYCIGSTQNYRSFIAKIAEVSDAKVLAINYRLAPEHPFPAALEDALMAYRWLLKNNIDPKNIVVAGDSAGGNLAMSLMLSLKDSHEPLPAAAVCLAGVFDLTQIKEGSPFYIKLQSDPILNPKLFIVAEKAYCGGKSPGDPYISPLFGDLKGLPPIFLQGGTDDALFSDSTRFYDKAKKAGVDVTLDAWEDTVHVFQFLYNLVPEARIAVTRIGDFIKKI